MTILVDKESFIKALNITDSVIASKLMNSILSNTLLAINDKEMILIATDNEIAVRTKISVISNIEKTLLINAKKMIGIIRELPNDEIQISIEDKYQIKITSKSKDIKGHYTLIALPNEGYPTIPEFKNDSAIVLDQSLLKEIIKKVIYAASSDTIKPVFNGILITIDSNNKISAVATDSRRLAIIVKNLQNDNDNRLEIIVPLKTINEIYRLLQNTGKCEFSVHNNQFFIKIGDTEIISRIVDGQFPNYKQVMPREYIAEVEIDTEKFHDSVKRAMVFTKEPANKLILSFSGKKLIIRAQTPELGESEEEIELLKGFDDSITIGINAQFLIDALKEINADTIQCGITGQMSPLTIVPKADDTFTSIIMPIQIKSSM